MALVMFLNTVLFGDDKKSVEEKGFLEITRQTVKLENDIYQFHNVTGFGIGQVKTKGIPGIIIFILLLVGIALLSIVGYEPWGTILTFLSFAGLAYNIKRPKLYGLSIYLNSGKEKIFLTQDMDFLRYIVKTLKKFMDNPKEGRVVNIRIGRDVKGNITVGDVHGNISNT